MTKTIQTQRVESAVNMKKTREGRIQKKNDESTNGIPIEKKNYKINELSAIQGKLKKVDVELTVEEEKSEGRSIMVNMKTSIFELLKPSFLSLLERSNIVKDAKQTRTAKSTTENGQEADI